MASTGITAQLLAGNTVIFKPSEYTTLTQKLFVDLFNKAGLPEGVLQCVVGGGDVGAALIDSDIDLVWFTGSTAVGQQIYKKCAEKFIKPLLELGGSSPALVFADCDLQKAVDTLYTARFFNCGQVCSAVKRVFVEKSIFEKFVVAMTAKLQTVSVGNPMGDVQIGPLVSEKQLNTLVSQVEDAKKLGATVEIGGDKPVGKEFEKGNYYLPTILTNVNPDMRVIKEEVFGPVMPIVPFDDEAQAIRQANHTPYGLTAEIFTSDMEKANRVASQIQAGGVSINMDVSYNPDSPIGGYKKSGLGREYGLEGFRELAQLKYISSAK
jgi:acyl-CoA reductase-like NAD-dependent aldehyde dehydrogenase